MIDALELLRRRPPDHAVDVVALLEQQLGQVGTVLAGDSRDQRARHQTAASSCSRNQLTVAAMPSSTPIFAFQPSTRSAFSTEGQRRTTSTLKLGRCSSSSSAGSLPQASQQMRAISATVSSSEAEMLKSWLSPSGRAMAVT